MGVESFGLASETFSNVIDASRPLLSLSMVGCVSTLVGCLGLFVSSQLASLLFDAAPDWGRVLLWISGSSGDVLLAKIAVDGLAEGMDGDFCATELVTDG